MTLEEKLANERAYSLELQKALTSLTCGGSEFFIRHNDGYRADINACLNYINDRHRNLHKALIRAKLESKSSNA